MIADLDKVAYRDAEHVAEQDVIQVLVGLHLGEEDEAETEHAGEHDAHHRVLLNAAVLRQVARRQSTGEAGDESADGKRQPQHEGEHDAWQHGMRDCVAHERPALEHQVAG